MSDKHLYTIGEYAKLKGVSKTHIYNLLKSTLKECLVIENGVKYIDISKVRESAGHTNYETQQQATAQQTDSKVEEQETTREQPNIEEYKIEIERLRTELEEERRFSREKDKKVLELMDKVMQLTENTQTLTARVQEQQVMLQQSKHKALFLTDGEERKGLFGWFRRRK